MQKQILVSESYNENKNKYDRGNHIVGVSMWEFEWCPKYRYKMFRKWKYRKLIEACIRRAASRWNIKWIELNVQPDHIQGTASIPMDKSPPHWLFSTAQYKFGFKCRRHPKLLGFSGLYRKLALRNVVTVHSMSYMFYRFPRQ